MRSHYEKAIPDDFAAAWLSLNRLRPSGTAMWLASEWVVGAELQWAKHRPDDLLDVICLLLSRNLSEWELELLGSGPIETLLSLNYDDMVNRVMEIARQNKDAQTALLFVDPPPDKESHFDQLLIGVRM